MKPETNQPPPIDRHAEFQELRGTKPSPQPVEQFLLAARPHMDKVVEAEKDLRDHELPEWARYAHELKARRCPGCDETADRSGGIPKARRDKRSRPRLKCNNCGYEGYGLTSVLWKEIPSRTGGRSQWIMMP